MPHRSLPVEISAANVNSYFKEIEAIYKVLVSQRSLAPCEKINGLFSRLVYMTHPACFRLHKEYFPDEFKDLSRRLHSLCSMGEYQLERDWSQRIANSSDPSWELYTIPYIKNYRALTKLEYTNLCACCAAPPRRILFIGSGPLPLTSYFLAKDYDCDVEKIDKSENAVSLARNVSVTLKIDDQCRFRCCDVFKLTELERYEVIF